MQSITKFGFRAIIYAWLGLGLMVSAAQAERLDISKFHVLDGAGQKVALDQYHGKPVLLHFWATWCAPCIKELPDIVALRKRLGDRLVVLPLSEDFEPAKVAAFLQQKGIELPVMLDEKSAIFRELKARGLPYSVLLDESGNEIFRHAGAKKDWAGFDPAALPK